MVFPIETPENNYNTLIDHIRNNLEDFNESNKDNFRLSLSFGKAVYDPKHPISIDKLLSQADTEMYKEKKSKNNRSVNGS